METIATIIVLATLLVVTAGMGVVAMARTALLGRSTR